MSMLPLVSAARHHQLLLSRSLPQRFVPLQ
jgi:hypothetical protein